jgi:hypothetical protein
MKIQERDIPLDIIRQWLADNNCDVRQAAMNACYGRKDIPLGIIRQGLVDDDCDVRQAAMNACNSRKDIPLDIIEQWLADDDHNVRQAAMNACYGRKDIPLDIITASRKFIVPELVYKRAVGGGIITAKIPEIAFVNGSLTTKCRASQAEIIAVENSPFGEIAVSIYDMETSYAAGEHITIPDYDMSTEECAPGFHFFCSREQAEAFKM